jgi:hypothetical protein
MEIDAPDGVYDPQMLKNVILAVAPDARVKVFTPLEKVLPPLDPMSKEDVALTRRAKAIADAIMEAPKSASWKGIYLLSLLVGGDTWEMSEGDAKESPRPRAIAFSRYMKKKKLFNESDSPVQHLAYHHRVYFKEGGGYKGVEYIPTKLGKLVYEELKKLGWPQA